MNAEIRITAIFLSLMAIVGPSSSAAQTTQVVEDSEFGVRLLIPKSWSWERKSNGPFISCEPKKDNPPVCYLSVEIRKAAPNQSIITDADRRTWKEWASGGGMQQVHSVRDVKIAGYPAFETVSKTGRDTVYRVFVLVDSPPRVIDMTFYGSGDGKNDYYSQHKPAIDTALRSLTPASRSSKPSSQK